MSGYYLAPSLVVLRAEIDTRWPHRDRTSDGWIGDTAHQARPSDHNPNSRGSVNAIDVDEDGLDFATVFARIRRHPSARYVIYERRLYHRLRGWRPEPYSGTNPHDKHFHVSIDQTREAEQDRRPWGLLEVEMTEAEIIAATRKGVHGLLKEAAAAAGMKNVGEPTATGRQVRDYLGAVLVHTLAGQDLVDEPGIVSGILATLTPAAIASAIPPGIAGQVVDELRDRLVDAEQVRGGQGQAGE